MPVSLGRPILRMLLIAHVDRLASRLDRNQLYRYQALARRPGVTLFGPGIAGYRPGMTVNSAIAIACDGIRPDVILHGMDFKESGVPLLQGLPETECLTALELQDSWAVPDQQAAFINREQFDLGLLIVRHHRRFYQERCPRTEFLWTPHAVNTELFRDYGLPKRWDMLIYGALNSHTYPFRARLADLFVQSDLRVRLISHPGYYPMPQKENPAVITGAELSREINQARITISTSGIYRCVMMKYFETAASRSLIAGDMPDEGRVLFGNDFLELSPEQTDGEILQTIKNCLSGFEAWQLKADCNYERAHRDHSTDAFADRLLRHLALIVARWQHGNPLLTS